MSKLPVIVDTDVFGDSDDILAITYLLANQDKVDIKLIVTADEHQGMRAAWLQHYFAQAGVNIPVVAGLDLGNTRLYLFEKIATDQVNFDYKQAIKIAIETLDEVTYLCLAPQSNLASFITDFPELKNKLKVSAMGAVLDMDLGRIEHNVHYGIKSFQTVAAQMSPKLLLADHTWHESMKFSPDTEIYRFLKQSKHPLAEAIIKNADLFFTKLYPQSRFHDPILVSSLFTDFVRFTKTTMIIEDSGKTRRPSPQETGLEATVSAGVDYEATYAHFLDSLKKYFLV